MDPSKSAAAEQLLYGIEGVLSEVDPELYFEVLLVCASGDGFVAPEERAWVSGLADAVGGAALAEKVRAYQPSGDVFRVLYGRQIPHYARRLVVYDGIRACAADRDLGEGEWEAVMALASAVGVGDEEIRLIKRLIRDERALVERRRDVLFPDELPGSRGGRAARAGGPSPP